MVRTQELMAALDQLTLEVPPEASFISMARMFAGSVARHFWCEEDEVEDIKIAVSEACTSAVKAHQAFGVADPIMVRAQADASTLTFEVIDKGTGSDGVAGDVASDGLQSEGVGVALISALFGSTTIESGSAGTIVRFSLPIARIPIDD